MVAMAADGGYVRQMYPDGGWVASGPTTTISNDEWEDAKAKAAAPVTQAAQPVSAATPAVPGPASPEAGPQSRVGKFFSAFKDDQAPSDGSTMTPSQKAIGSAGTAIGTGIGKGLSSLFGSSSSKEDAAPAAAQYAPQDDLGNSAQTSGGISQGAFNALQEAGENIGDSGDPGMYKGGRVPALLSPGEQYLPPKDVKKVIREGKNPLDLGERIPGKPKYPGNDYRNDTEKKTLKEGGMVIPNEVMQSKNPHFESMKFVHAHIAKNRGILPKRSK